LLDSLRWNWDEAYLIHFFEPDSWIARRRDSGEELRATTPLGLRDAIVEDYTARPVSKAGSPAVLPQRDSRFRAEG
jgi:hypothetical protein